MTRQGPCYFLTRAGAIAEVVQSDGGREFFDGDPVSLGDTSVVNKIREMLISMTRRALKEAGLSEDIENKVNKIASAQGVTVHVGDDADVQRLRLRIAELARNEIDTMIREKEVPETTCVTVAFGGVDISPVTKRSSVIRMIKKFGVKKVVLIGDSIGTEQNPGGDRSMLTLRQKDLEAAGIDWNVDLIQLYAGNEEVREIPEYVYVIPESEKSIVPPIGIYEAVINAKRGAVTPPKPLAPNMSKPGKKAPDLNSGDTTLNPIAQINPSPTSAQKAITSIPVVSVLELRDDPELLRIKSIIYESLEEKAALLGYDFRPGDRIDIHNSATVVAGAGGYARSIGLTHIDVGIDLGGLRRWAATKGGRLSAKKRKEYEQKVCKIIIGDELTHAVHYLLSARLGVPSSMESYKNWPQGWKKTNESAAERTVAQFRVLSELVEALQGLRLGTMKDPRHDQASVELGIGRFMDPRERLLLPVGTIQTQNEHSVHDVADSLAGEILNTLDLWEREGIIAEHEVSDILKRWVRWIAAYPISLDGSPLVPLYDEIRRMRSPQDLYKAMQRDLAMAIESADSVLETEEEKRFARQILFGLTDRPRTGTGLPQNTATNLKYTGTMDAEEMLTKFISKYQATVTDVLVELDEEHFDHLYKSFDLRGAMQKIRETFSSDKEFLMGLSWLEERIDERLSSPQAEPLIPMDKQRLQASIIIANVHSWLARCPKLGAIPDKTTPPVAIGPLTTESSSVTTAKAEAVRIHEEDLKIENMPDIPTTPDKTILCHIVTDSIVPLEQRNILKVKLEQAMDKENRHIERVALLSGANAEDPEAYIRDLERLMQKKSEHYRSIGYTNVRFDVACPNIGLVNSLLEKNIGVKAIAFKPCESDVFSVVQAEGIILALRALYSGDIDKLKAAFVSLSKTELSQEQAAITNIDDFIKAVSFILPAAKIEDPAERRRIHDLIVSNIWQAA